MYDLIGDIHGRAVELEALLIKLSYRRVGAGYRHEKRKVIYLGDFIDRGPSPPTPCSRSGQDHD